MGSDSGSSIMTSKYLATCLLASALGQEFVFQQVDPVYEVSEYVKRDLASYGSSSGASDSYGAPGGGGGGGFGGGRGGGGGFGGGASSASGNYGAPSGGGGGEDLVAELAQQVDLMVLQEEEMEEGVEVALALQVDPMVLQVVVLVEDLELETAT